MVSSSNIPFIDLQAQRHRLGSRIDTAIARVLEHGQFVMGPEVSELEARLAAFAGVRNVIACSNGTDALLLPLFAWDIGPGDAVFVPSFTFVAAAEVVKVLGATPVFVDVEPVRFGLDAAKLPAAVEHARSLGLRPRAVVPVDLYGQCADYPAIEAVAASEGLLVLEDAAQSFGAMLDNRRAGTMGHVAATSFFPAKPLGCYGDGGAVFTDDDELADRIRRRAAHGQGDAKYSHVDLGLNCRLDTLQAAILIEKLDIFPDEIEARQRVAARYDALLRDLVETPVVVSGATSVWAQYTIRVDDRDRVADAVRAAGVPVAVHYPIALPDQPAYGDCPVAPEGAVVSRELAQRVLSLPMHPYLDEPTQDRIVAVVRAAVLGSADLEMRRA